MALRYSFKLSYDHNKGVKLPTISGVLFPHLMTDTEIALILDNHPHLRKFWTDSGIDLPDTTPPNSGIPNDANGDGEVTVEDFLPVINIDFTPLERKISVLGQFITLI